ncbi:hypothetical protein V1507DRAFT_461327 [Lipomyces tetrasporus]
MVWSMVHDPILPSTDDSTQNLYALAVLDCGYGGAVVRPGTGESSCAPHAANRSTVRSRTDCVSFIQRFRQAALALKNAENLSVNVERLFGGLQRLKPLQLRMPST